jgi:hypothetical protein
MKKMQVFAERLTRLFDVVLKISTNDYRITLSDRLGNMVDVYIRDDIPGKISTRKEVIVAIQTLELFAPENFLVAYHWCLCSHEQFDRKKSNEVAA